MHPILHSLYRLLTLQFSSSFYLHPHNFWFVCLSELTMARTKLEWSLMNFFYFFFQNFLRLVRFSNTAACKLYRIILQRKYTSRFQNWLEHNFILTCSESHRIMLILLCAYRSLTPRQAYCSRPFLWRKKTVVRFFDLWLRVALWSYAA